MLIGRRELAIKAATSLSKCARCGCAALLISTLACGGSSGGGDALPTPETGPPRYSIGETLRELSGSRGGAGAMPVRIFYPAAHAAREAPASGGAHPLVVFSHGYQQSYADYAYVWRALVPAGYIVALPDRLSSDATISIDAYAADIAHILAELYRMAATGDPVLGGRLTPASALMGHSTGGGASVIAQANQRQVAAARQATTLILLAPLGRTFGPISGTDPTAVAGETGVPSLILGAGMDCICPVTENARALFEALGTTTTKYLVTVDAGDHCGFSDESGPGRNVCEIAEAMGCLLGQGPTISPAEQNDLAARLLLPWLDHGLKNDATAWETFRARTADPRLTVEAYDAPGAFRLEPSKRAGNNSATWPR